MASERLSGPTPGIVALRFHFWYKLKQISRRKGWPDS